MSIPITIRPLFWLLAFLIGYLSMTTMAGIFVAVAIVLISVLIHEFGHALTACCFGQKARIELAAFGGFTYREGERLKLWQEFLVVINGPFAGLLWALVSAIFLHYTPESNQLLHAALYFCVQVNVFWTLINLLPVMPLDGGHLLSIILEAIFGFKGIKMAVITGFVLSIAICALFFITGSFLPGAIFLLLTFESYRALRYYKLFTEKDRDGQLQVLMAQAQEDEQNGFKDRAMQKYTQIRKSASQGVLFTAATEAMAKIHRDEGHFELAYQLLLPLEKSLEQDSIQLLHYLAFMNQDWQKVGALSNDSYQVRPVAETALLNAISFAKLKQPEPAVGWLSCAIREGLPSADHVVAREEFDALRDDKRFIELVNSLKERQDAEQ